MYTDGIGSRRPPQTPHTCCVYSHAICKPEPGQHGVRTMLRQVHAACSVAVA